MEYNGQRASKGIASGILYWAKEGEDIPDGCILEIGRASCRERV